MPAGMECLADAAATGAAAAPISQIIVWAVTSIIGVAASAFVTLKITTAKVDAIDRQLQDLQKAGTAQAERIAGAELARSQCEVRSAHNYVTKSELFRITADNVQGIAALDGKLSEGFESVHSRITQIATAVSAITARQEYAGVAAATVAAHLASKEAEEKERRGA